MNPLHVWGAAGTVMLAIVLGLFYQTNHLDKRIDDLRNEFTKRIDDLRSEMNHHFEDLIRYLAAELAAIRSDVKRLDERVAKIYGATGG